MAIEGETLRVPTAHETLRVKAWLVVNRNATRDYLDVAALSDYLSTSVAAEVLTGIDDYYVDDYRCGCSPGASVVTQLVRQLAEPRPYDLDEVDLRYYKRLVPR